MGEDKYMIINGKMKALSFDFYNTWKECIEELYKNMTGWLTHSEERNSVEFLTDYNLRVKKIDDFINSGYVDLMSMVCDLNILHDIAQVKKDYGRCGEFFKLIYDEEGDGTDYNDDMENVLSVYNDALYSIFCANEFLKQELKSAP